MRDNTGRYVIGHTETPEEKNKRINGMRATWKDRPDYLGDIKHSPLYNAWRSFMFTTKGKKAGACEAWKKFKGFYEDMKDSYQPGLRLGRINKTIPFSKENCIWMTDKELAMTREGTVILEHNGRKKTLYEWAIELEVPYSPLRQRYYKGKNYTSEEILFGRYSKRGYRKIKDIGEHNAQAKKDKVSKMVSAYKCRDKKRKLHCDLTNEWFYENIVKKPCTYCETTLNVGCDRVDNKLGHTMDNVIPSCYRCNTVRGDNFTVQEMKKIGEVIKEIITNRN